MFLWFYVQELPKAQPAVVHRFIPYTTAASQYTTYNFTTCAISQNVKYWYEIYTTYWYQFFTRCEELVPIFHNVKFAKCEICGSTVRLSHDKYMYMYICRI